jgi:hypothetical protein
MPAYRIVRARALFRLSLALAALIAAVALLTPLAYAKISLNTIDPILTVSHDGRHVLVSGPLACDRTQPVLMRVTVTQRTTGAIAEGYATVIGSTTERHWQIHAHTLGGPKFEPGAATVVGLARSGWIGHADDAHQWLVNVTLVEN